MSPSKPIRSDPARTPAEKLVAELESEDFLQSAMRRAEESVKKRAQRRKELFEKPIKAKAIAFEAEQTRLRAAGRADLANAVRIVSTDHRLGYDIASFEADGTPRHIEVKAVSGSGNRMDFFVTENERRKSTELANYWFYLVQNAESPRPLIRCAAAHTLPPDALTPVVYRASVASTGSG